MGLSFSVTLQQKVLLYSEKKDYLVVDSETRGPAGREDMAAAGPSQNPHVSPWLPFILILFEAVPTHEDCLLTHPDLYNSPFDSMVTECYFTSWTGSMCFL